jgi:hypothetical protein
MKTYHVTIRGQERLLRFTSADAVALKRKHGKTVLRLIREDVLAQDLDGNLTGDTDIEVQASLVATCLQRGGMKVTELEVLQFFDELFLSENPDARIGDLVMPAVAAAFYSGAVTGRSKDIFAKRDESDQAAAEGNATPSGGSGQA